MEIMNADTPLCLLPLKPLKDEEVSRLLHEHADSDLMHAVLIVLRDLWLDAVERGHNPPAYTATAGDNRIASTAPTSAEWRAQFAGKALGFEDAARALLLGSVAEPEVDGSRQAPVPVAQS